MRPSKRNEKGVLESSSIFYVPSSSFAKEALYHLEHIGIFYCSDDYRVKRDYRDNFLMMFVQSGHMAVRYREQEYIASAGDVVLLDCKELHEYRATEMLILYYFHYNGCSSQSYFDLLYRELGCIIHLSNWKDIESTFKAILHQVRNPSLNEHFVSVLIHKILSELTTGMQTEISNRDDRIHKIMNYINDHHGEAISLGQIAAYMKISESHLAHFFKKMTGETPHHFLINVRISHARHMLITTNATLEEIAIQCGFQSVTNFIRSFKKQTGVTPHQFRLAPQ